MAHKLPSSGRILGMDIGDARIGLATAHVVARIPAPIETIANDSSTIHALEAIIIREDVRLIVVGVPRNLSGEETPQSLKIREQAADITRLLGKDVVFVDESMSSKRADAYLAENPKSEAPQDSIAACFILEEFTEGFK